MGSSSPVTAAVAGASGYAGGELLRLLTGHPDLDLVLAAASGKAGMHIGDVHPQLVVLDLVLAATDPATLAQADVVFLALPHGRSSAVAAHLPSDVLVVDLGADHRLRDPAAWRAFYDSEHAGSWLYGLPELPDVRPLLPGQKRVANPGCYPTAIITSLWPLLSENLIEGDLVVVAASGTSGAGRSANEALLATEIQGSMRAYKVGGTHQHIPEIEQALHEAGGDEVVLSFTPTLAPMSRGILATSLAPLAPGVSEAQLRNALEAAYADEPFVHVLPQGRWPATASTYGSNSVLLQVAADQHAGKAVVVAAMDNLVKGAAGQAIQNANLALGLDETAGLPATGVAP